MRRRSRPNLGDRGTGLLGTALGVAAIVAILGFATNVMLGLWVRSTVDAAAYDAATRVATSGVDVTDVASLKAVEESATAHAKASLGEFGSRVDMKFLDGGDPERVQLRIRAPGVSLLPRMIGGGAVVGALDRQIVVRREGR